MRWYKEFTFCDFSWIIYRCLRKSTWPFPESLGLSELNCCSNAESVLQIRLARVSGVL